MPMRVMGYDYAAYKKQYDRNTKKYRKQDGSNPWDGAATLHEMLDIPDKMKTFVNDYKIHLVEVREKAKREAIEYATAHNVDKTVLMTVAGATNCTLDYNTLSKKGDITMYTLFNEIAKDGKAEGISRWD